MPDEQETEHIIKDKYSDDYLEFGGIETDPHFAVAVRLPERGNEWLVDCNCGAKWTHKKNELVAKILSIHESHVAYFKRKPMETL